MKPLVQYEKEIKTCSKCGLCQSVCPLYAILGNETAISRGKFNLILGLLKGEVKFSKNFVRIFNTCLNCGACEGFCPSGISAVEIFSALKTEYFKEVSGFRRYFKTPFFAKICFSCLALGLKLGRILKFDKVFNFLFINLRFFGLRIFAEILKKNRLKVLSEGNSFQSLSGRKVVYFTGCYSKYVSSSSSEALCGVLKSFGIEVIVPEFDCCGISYYYSGDEKNYEKLKNKNLKILSKILSKNDADCIISDCATCVSAVKKYGISPVKVMSLPEYLGEVSGEIRAQFDIKDVKFTYHLPCHLRCSADLIDKFLTESFGENYVKMEKWDECCGFAGGFCVENGEIASEIMQKKAENIEKSGIEIVLTSCPGCIIGLNMALAGKNSHVRISTLEEFIM